ncbi:hypothetical protein [Limosilactobacillus sp.]|uniref:hypothetical protein n=1 Tax=Limosilactobacillus sp. TaxID=2773925 RepID=UPI003F108EC7
MARDTYQRPLQNANTVAECQALYEAELANKKREYRKDYPETYLAMVAAHEVDDWIKAENQAKLLKGGSHSYGNLIHRQLLQK